MSRTYRRSEEWLHHANGQFYTTEEWLKVPHSDGWELAWNLNKRGRDRKPWDKPPKWFKRMNRRKEKAQVRQAMKNEDYDNIPHFKKYDGWDWT